MGVVLTTALIIWAAASYLEYKIVSSVSWLDKVFHKALPAILISLLVGAAVAFAATGSPTGPAFFIAQIIGLSTNNLTYGFFRNLAKVNAKRHEVQSRVRNVKQSNPKVFNEVMATAKMGVKTIGFILFATVWLIGLPGRIGHHAKRISGRGEIVV